MADAGSNHPGLSETFFATGLIGAVRVLVNPRLEAAEVEHALLDVPGVAEAAVIDVPDERGRDRTRLRRA